MYGTINAVQSSSSEQMNRAVTAHHTSFFLILKENGKFSASRCSLKSDVKLFQAGTPTPTHPQSGGKARTARKSFCMGTTSTASKLQGIQNLNHVLKCATFCDKNTFYCKVTV